MRCFRPVLLIALVVWCFPAHAAKKPKPIDCDWKGEERDPFTGLDTRTAGRSWMTGLSLRLGRVAGDVSRVSATVSRAGVIDQPMDQPILFLLADGTVVSAPPVAPVVGVPGANQYGAFTTYQLNFDIPKADVERIASSTGVTRIRLVLPGGEWTMTFNDGDYMQVPNYAKCALGQADQAEK